MKCEQCHEQLVLYVEGLLDGQEQHQVELHLQQCPGCKAEASQCAQLHNHLVASGKALAQKNLAPAVMDRIAEEQTSKPRRIAMLKKYKNTGFAGAAAAIVLLILVTWGTFFNSQVAAAQMLREIALINQAYDGWIHITPDSIPEAMQPQGGPRVKTFTLHLNPAREVGAKVIDWGTHRSIDWRDRAEGVFKAYSSTTNEIIIDEDPEGQSKDGKTMIEQIADSLKSKEKSTPWHLAQNLFVLPTLEGIMALVDYGCDVTYQRQGQYDSFELTLRKEKALHESDSRQPFLTVLVDRDTKLIHRWTGKFDQTTWSNTFTYNDPVFDDIYDLGVPADAKVIDCRENLAAKDQAGDNVTAIFDRLDSRIGANEKLGNYVAVITESVIDENGTSTPQALRLYCRNGDAWFYGYYRGKKLLSEALGVTDWPQVQIDQIIERACNIAPDIILATDGQKGWHGRYNRNARSYQRFTKLTFERIETGWLKGFSLSGTIWPGRHMLNLQHRPRISIKMHVLTDPQRPGQIGLHVDELGWDRMPIIGPDVASLEKQYWIDPARNDVPIELIRKEITKNGDIRRETRKKYLSYSQLVDGTWYPTRWQTSDTSAKHPTLLEAHLQIFPNIQLDQSWFTNPAERFKSVSDDTQ